MSKTYSELIKKLNRKGLPKFQGDQESSTFMEAATSDEWFAVPKWIKEQGYPQKVRDFFKNNEWAQVASANLIGLPQAPAMTGQYLGKQLNNNESEENQYGVDNNPYQDRVNRGLKPATTPQRKNISPIAESSFSKDFDFTNNKPSSELLKEAVSGNMLTDDPNIMADYQKAVKEEEPQKRNQYQEINPYAGVDIPSAAVFLGQSIKNKDLLGITAGGLKTGLGVARNIMSGMGMVQRQQDINREYDQNQKENLMGRPVMVGKDGGYIDFSKGGLRKYEEGGKMLPEEKVLTGEIMTGISENNKVVQPNAELENGEYIHSQDGSSIKVEGRDHKTDKDGNVVEGGGEKVELKEGDRVISNHLKLKGDNAKELSKMFDMKVSAKDTYAKAVDKAYSKIGLQKLIKEEESIIKKIKETKDVKDETTQNLNKEFLSKRLNEIQEKKQELEPQRQEILTTVFNLQEASKPKEEQAPQEAFQDGGVMSLAKQMNMSPERAQALIEEFKKGGKYKDYQPGGTAMYNDPDIDFSGANVINPMPAGQKTNIPFVNQFGNLTPEDIQNSIQRNSWYFSQHPDFNIGNQNDVLQYQKTYNQKARQLGLPTVKEDGLWGEQTNSIRLNVELPSEDLSQGAIQNLQAPQSNVAPTDKFLTPSPNTKNKQLVGEESNADDKEKDKKSKDRNKNYGALPLTPDQGVLPPSAMASQLNVERRFDRVDPNLMSAEQMIVENNRAAQSAIQAAADLPDSQRAATIAQINANLQNANNQAIAQIESANTQVLNQVEAQNAQVQMAEENARVQDALGYEQRQQTAEAITEENWRQFYNYLRKLNAVNFNDVRRRNTLNQMFENYKIDSLGNVAMTGESPSAQDFLAGISSQSEWDKFRNMSYEEVQAYQAKRRKEAKEKLEKQAVAQEGGIYTIKKGDTLSKIAANNNTTVAEIAKLNNIEDVNKIYAGDNIVLRKAPNTTQIESKPPSQANSRPVPQVDPDIDFSNFSMDKYRIAPATPRETVEKTSSFNTITPLKEEVLKTNLILDKNLDLKSLSKQEIIDLQKDLVSRGYDLGKFGKNKDGVDGTLGTKTKKAYRDYIKSKEEKTENNDNLFSINPSDKCDTEFCTAYVGEQLENMFGEEGRQALNAYGDAWTFNSNILDFGGQEIFSIFPDKKPDIKGGAKEIERYIQDRIEKTDSLDYKKIKAGDTLNIFYPGSDFAEKAYNEGDKYFTSHAGIVKKDKKGNLFVEHNVGGKVYKNPLKDFVEGKVKNKSGKNMRITAVVRPNYEDVDNDILTKFKKLKKRVI